MASTKQNEKPAAPSVDEATVDAVLSTIKARDRRALLEKEKLVTEPRFLLAIGGEVRSYSNRRTAHSEGVELPRTALIFPGETVHEQSPGDRPLELDNVYEGTVTPFWRPLTWDEAAVAVSDKMAVAYGSAKAPVLGAVKFASAVGAASMRLRTEIAELERKLADKRADLEQNERLETSAAKAVEGEKAKLDTWVADSGRTVEALEAAAALLVRPAPEAEAGPTMRVVPRPADFRESLS